LNTIGSEKENKVTPPVLMETSKTYFISLCVRSIEGL